MGIISQEWSFVVCVQELETLSSPGSVVYSVCGLLSRYVAANEVKQASFQNIRNVK